jgi:hypothetical protein
LSQGGYYAESDVWPVALQLAAYHVQQRQRPRQPDPMPKRLGAPMPTPPQVQQAEPIWTGYLRRARLSLGDGYSAMREETRDTVRALIATALRQPVDVTARDAQALAVSPVGTPPGLGALVKSQVSE